MPSDSAGVPSRLLRVCCLPSLLISAFVPGASSFAIPASFYFHSAEGTTRLHLSDKNKDHLTTAKRERRDEDVRRNDRKGEAVPGKTSAIPGAKDYPINPTLTTQEWMKHATKVEQQVYHLTEEGMSELKMFKFKQAAACFDQVYQLRPNAYLWQAGIPEFYLGNYVKGATIMSQCAVLAETKYGLPASEELIWRAACHLKYKVAMSKSKEDWESTFPKAPQFGLNDVPETRKVIQLAEELFTSTLDENSVGLALSRAKLRAICNSPTLADHKMWKLTSWFYLGLHYDVIGKMKESKECLKQALRLCPNAKGDDIIQALPMLHMSARDWFDDDDFSEAYDPSEKEAPAGSTTDAFMASIQQSVREMKLVQIQNELKLRGLKCHGRKEDMERKLVATLCADFRSAPNVENQQL